MAALKIANDIYSVGILNPSMRVFDVIMRTDYGTSYNSYVVKGKERTALIDTNHKTFWQQYLSNISEVTAFDAIDYIILNHNEPDHSGALTELMKLAKNATVVASQAGSFYLKGITNRPDLNVQVVKDGDIIDLGGENASVYQCALFALARFDVHLGGGGKSPFFLRFFGYALLRTLWFRHQRRVSG